MRIFLLLLLTAMMPSFLHAVGGRHALIICNQNYKAVASPTPDPSAQSDGKSGPFNSTIAPAVTLKLQSSDGETYQVRQINPIKRSVFVIVGKSFGFERGNERFKITSSSKRVVKHPVLGAVDCYVVKISDSASGMEFELVQGIEADVPPAR